MEKGKTRVIEISEKAGLTESCVGHHLFSNKESSLPQLLDGETGGP